MTIKWETSKTRLLANNGNPQFITRLFLLKARAKTNSYLDDIFGFVRPLNIVNIGLVVLEVTWV